MTNPTFKQMRHRHTWTRFKVCDKKSEDYAAESDRLMNFKRTGAGLSLPPETVLMIFATKHFDAINSFVRAGGKDDRSEPIIGRIYDLQNYLDLLLGLIEERGNVAE
jgi:hypothetical protein